MYKHSKKRGPHDIKHNLNKVKDALAVTAYDVGTQAKDSLEVAKDRIIDKTNDLQVSVAGYIGDKPFKAMGLAMLSGLILGFAMHTKKKRRHYNSHR